MPIIEDVRRAAAVAGGGASAYFGVSSNGSMVYIPSGSALGALLPVEFVDNPSRVFIDNHSHPYIYTSEFKGHRGERADHEAGSWMLDGSGDDHRLWSAARPNAAGEQ